MGTVETRSSKTPSGCSSPSPENDKNELREALCALKGRPRENGVFETKVSVQSDFVRREVEDDDCQGLADSEMNGVSSLLKMRGSSFFDFGMEGGRRKDLKKSEDEDGDDQYGKIFTVDVPIVETSENKDLEIEDLGNECFGFSVGDFVWGKIKSHPWWPGRIYDHTDASDFALKLRQKNRVLVAYFGDGTFAWCHPSQLKPFEENFEDMVMQSGSRAFVNAVQEAVDEVGRLLNLKMSYSYDAKKARYDVAPPMAKNSGIKEGHIVPENGIERFSNILIDPAELLSRVKQIAEVITVSSILELEVLKARLSAFYRSRGGYELPNYVEPQLIPGLEDSSVDETVVVGNSKGAVEAPFQGPFEEDYSTLPVSPKSGYSQGISGNHWRKQKSIAEIMGKEDKGVSTKNKEGDASKDVMVSRKKRKGSEDSVPSKPVQKRKCFLPSTYRKVASAENECCGGKENSDKSTLLQLKEKKEAFGNENASSESKKVTDEGNTKEENEKGFLSRKRKKSKYLSPPFTTPTRGQRKGNIETESLKASSNAPPSEPITRPFDQQPLKSPVLLKCNGEAFQENFSKKLAIEPDLSDSSNYRTPDDDKNRIIDPTVIQIPSREFLSKVRYAAINPQILRDINSLEKLVAFISVYRSSIYCQGSYYKIYSKHQPGRKRKKPESDLRMLAKDRNQTDHISSPNDDSVPRKRRKETISGVPEEKRSAKSKTRKKGTDDEAAAALLVSFGPGSSLPSKYDLVTVYSKFGALNESETDMLSSNYTAQVSFLKASDAEKALNHSQNMSPFGSSQVSFRLQYLSAGSKSGEHGIKSPSSEASKLNYIKQKLLGMTSMLEALDGMSPDMKTQLEREMKQLVEDVNKMVESFSS